MTEDLSPYQEHALSVARGLVTAGVPVFAAAPDAGRPTGYALPLNWQRTDTTASHRALRMWRPGMALCAVMGHTLDLLDFDPRNGSPNGELSSWPVPYATAATPSGGIHAFIAALGVGSRDGVLPGLDIKGGRPDGVGRGFAFIAPTVRASKVDGSLRAYEWTSEPDCEALPGLVPFDTSGAELAALVVGSRPGAAAERGASVNGSGPRWAGPSTELALLGVRPPGRLFTQEEAWRFVEPHLRALAGAPDGTRNARLNDAAKAFSHFGDDFWPTAWAFETLVGAVPPKEPGTGHRGWDARQTIASAYRSAERDWRAERDWPREGARFPGSPTVGPDTRGNRTFEGTVYVSGQELERARSRMVSIEPWLDGTYEPVTPSRGVERDDAVRLLYAGKWHTVIGGTECGKSWLGLAHAAEEMRAGRVVAYAHFEEMSPQETVGRLLSMGLDRQVLVERFVWLDCADSWVSGEFGYVLGLVHPFPSLVVLDGLNAACTRHGQDPAQVQAVGWYRAEFVTPATRNGAAVLSLGHPPKARDRQDERHGYGSTAWLDEVDGVGFRMRAHREHPIRRGATGSAQLYSAKDRPGSVASTGRAHDVEGWVYLGSLCVDNATDPDGGTRVHLSAPAPASDEGDSVDRLALAVVELLGGRPERRYESTRDLIERLGAAGVRFDRSDLGPALVRLEDAGRLVRDVEGNGRAARAGWLVDLAVEPSST